MFTGEVYPRGGGSCRSRTGFAVRLCRLADKFSLRYLTEIKNFAQICGCRPMAKTRNRSACLARGLYGEFIHAAVEAAVGKLASLFASAACVEFVNIGTPPPPRVYS